MKKFSIEYCDDPLQLSSGLAVIGFLLEQLTLVSRLNNAKSETIKTKSWLF